MTKTFDDVRAIIKAIEEATGSTSEVLAELEQEIRELEERIDRITNENTVPEKGQSFAAALNKKTTTLAELKTVLESKQAALEIAKGMKASLPFNVQELTQAFGEATNLFKEDSLAILEADVVEKKQAYLDSIERVKQAALEQQSLAGGVRLTALQAFGQSPYVHSIQTLEPNLFINREHRKESSHI